MISYFKNNILPILALLIVSAGIVVAQSADVAISLAPNPGSKTDTSLPVMYSGMVRSAGLGVNKSSLTANTLLDTAGEVRIEHDWAGNSKTWNCGTTQEKGHAPSNKCYRSFKASNTATERADYPEFVSMSSVNTSATGGVIVQGKSLSNKADLISDTFTTLTSGVKLDIVGTGLQIQGEPNASFMNHAAGIVYPTASCIDPSAPTCKKYACIDATGNIISCLTQASVDNVGPARPQCSDGIDNDGDGQTDGADLGCWCSGSYSQSGALMCGALTEGGTNNPVCPTVAC